MPQKRAHIEVRVVLSCLLVAGLAACPGYAGQGAAVSGPAVCLDGQEAVEVPPDLLAPGIPPVYAVRKVAVAPVIDGRGDDPAWQGVPRTRRMCVDREGRVPMARDTAVRMVRDDEYLYLWADCEFPHADTTDWGRRARDKVRRTSETVSLRLIVGKPAQETMVSFYPSGDFNDSLDDNLGWDGDITAATSCDASAWHLEARVKLPADLSDTLTADLWRNTSRGASGRWSQSQCSAWGLLTLAGLDLAVEDIRVGVFAVPGAAQDALPVRLVLRNLADHDLACTVDYSAGDAAGVPVARGQWRPSLGVGQTIVLAAMLDAPGAASVHMHVSAEGAAIFEADLPVRRTAPRGDCAAQEGLSAAIRSDDFRLSEEAVPAYLLGQSLGNMAVTCQGELVLLAADAQEPLWRLPVNVELAAGAGDAQRASVPLAGLAPGRYVLEWRTGRDSMPPLRHDFEYAPMRHIQRLADLCSATAVLESMRCPAPTDQADLALLEYKLDQLAGLLGDSGGADVVDRPLSIYQAYRQVIDIGDAIKTRGSWLGGQRGWTEAAFFSAVDGSAQPYALFVPLNYDPAADKRYPMEVWLHGSGQRHDREMQGAGEGQQLAVGDWFLLRPLARGRRCGYSGVAGHNVMQAIAAAKARYRIDEDAVHLCGSSMGGFGAFTIASEHPDLFATCMPVSGGGVWCRLEQMRNLPTIIHHGRLDTTVPPYCSILSAMKMQHFSCPVQLLMHAGADHNNIRGIVERSGYRDGLLPVRRDSQPSSLTLSGDALCFTHAYWAAIERFTDPQRPGRVDATFVGSNRLVLASHNVKWLSLKLTCKRIDPSHPLTIGREDGLSWTQITPGDAKAIYLRLDGDKIEATTDRPAELDDQTTYTGGGALRMFCEGRPVRIVYGSGGDPNTAAAAEAFAKGLRRVSFVRDDEFEVGGWPVLKDTEVNQETIEGCDLILLGTPADNALLARMADQLPVKIADGKVQVQANTPMQWAKDDVVFTLYYRNPLAKDRRIWWLCGFDDKKMLTEFTDPFGSDLAVGRKKDGVRIATAEVVGDWQLRRAEPLAPAKEVWATDMDLCQAFANELKGSFPVDIVLSDIGRADPNRVDYACLTAGEAAEMLRMGDQYVLELTGKELCQWYRKQTTSAPTRPATGEPERFQRAWAGIPVDQLKDDRVYRVLPCGGVIWNLAEANLPIRIVQYIPADDFFEPVRDRYLAAKGIKMPERKPTSQSSK